MPLSRLTPLDGESILPLADAKAHLRVTSTDEDALIGSLRDAAVAHTERSSGIALAQADYRWELRWFPPRIELPMGPVTAVSSVTYHDYSGVQQTYANPRLIGNIVYPVARSVFPLAYDNVTVEFTAGLTSPDDAPDLIAAAKLLVTHFYENRGAVAEVRGIVVELPLGFYALVDGWRSVLA